MNIEEIKEIIKPYLNRKVDWDKHIKTLAIKEADNDLKIGLIILIGLILLTMVLGLLIQILVCVIYKGVYTFEIADIPLNLYFSVVLILLSIIAVAINKPRIVRDRIKKQEQSFCNCGGRTFVKEKYFVNKNGQKSTDIHEALHLAIADSKIELPNWVIRLGDLVDNKSWVEEIFINLVITLIRQTMYGSLLKETWNPYEIGSHLSSVFHLSAKDFSRFAPQICIRLEFDGIELPIDYQRDWYQRIFGKKN